MDKKTKYMAFGISSTMEPRTKEGFPSYEEAEKYIFSWSCSHCRKAAEVGREEHEEEYEEVVIDSILDTACGAEWAIISDKEMKELNKNG